MKTKQDLGGVGLIAAKVIDKANAYDSDRNALQALKYKSHISLNHHLATSFLEHKQATFRW